METLGSIDLDLSLFNGDLTWVGLSSPVEVEPPTLPGQLGLPVKQDIVPVVDGLHKGGNVPLYEKGLDHALPDFPWLDARVDLSDLLRESNEELAASQAEISLTPLTVPSIDTQAGDQTIVTPATAEDLFNSIQSSGGSVTHLGSFQGPVVTDSDGDLLMQVLTKLTDDFDTNTLDSHITSLTASESVLSPVSAEDVESVLSYPGSPMDSLSENDISLDSLEDPDYVPEASTSRAVKSSGSSSRKRKYADVCGDEIKDKKLRKKVQNKSAALRYRQKKKSEQTILDEQFEALETRNKELKDKVSGMTQEINYLKTLMADVIKARQKRGRRV